MRRSISVPRHFCVGLLAGYLALSARPVAAKDAPHQRDDKAIQLVADRLHRFGAKLTAVAPDCMAYQVDKSSSTKVTVLVREAHNKRCGGDPNTAPTLATFHVTVKSGRVEIFDVIEDSFSDFDASWKPH